MLKIIFTLLLSLNLIASGLDALVNQGIAILDKDVLNLKVSEADLKDKLEEICARYSFISEMHGYNRSDFFESFSSKIREKIDFHKSLLCSSNGDDALRNGSYLYSALSVACGITSASCAFFSVSCMYEYDSRWHKLNGLGAHVSGGFFKSDLKVGLPNGDISSELRNKISNAQDDLYDFKRYIVYSLTLSLVASAFSDLFKKISEERSNNNPKSMYFHQRYSLLYSKLEEYCGLFVTENLNKHNQKVKHV